MAAQITNHCFRLNAECILHEYPFVPEFDPKHPYEELTPMTCRFLNDYKYIL